MEGQIVLRTSPTYWEDTPEEGRTETKQGEKTSLSCVTF